MTEPLPLADAAITYGPTGVRCGCGRDAHSNLSACQEEPATVYVALLGEYPIGVSGHFGDAKSAAELRHTGPNGTPGEYRWDKTSPGERWVLMVKNTHTGRWNKTYYFVSAAPIVDTPDAKPNQI